MPVCGFYFLTVSFIMSQITLTLTAPGKKLTKQERMKAQARYVLRMWPATDPNYQTEELNETRAKAMKILSE